MSRFLIAIDQGGSKTEIAVLLTSGEIIYRANDYSLRAYYNFDFESYRWFYISELIEASLKNIVATILDVDCLLAALCGADFEEDYMEMRSVLSKKIGLAPEKIIIKNDCEVALRSCLPIVYHKQNCAIIYAGTRFNCSVTSVSGKQYTYGKLVNVNDLGACAIGYAVWRSIIDSHNGFQDYTIMEKMFLELTKANSIPEYVRDISTDKRKFTPSMYSSVLFKALKEQDNVALKIFDSYVKRWSKYVVAGASKVGLTKSDSVDVYLSGGIFKNCTQLWISKTTEELTHYNSNYSCCLAEFEPIVGALLSLLEIIHGCPLNDFIVNNFIHSDRFNSMRYGKN